MPSSREQRLSHFSIVRRKPPVWDPVQRVRALRELLDPQSPKYCVILAMHENIRAVIHAYETGQIPNEGTVYFKRGKIVSEAEAQVIDTLVWPEVRFTSKKNTIIRLFKLTNITKTLASRANMLSIGRQIFRKKCFYKFAAWCCTVYNLFLDQNPAPIRFQKALEYGTLFFNCTPI